MSRRFFDKGLLVAASLTVAGVLAPDVALAQQAGWIPSATGENTAPQATGENKQIIVAQQAGWIPSAAERANAARYDAQAQAQREIVGTERICDGRETNIIGNAIASCSGEDVPVYGDVQPKSNAPSGAKAGGAKNAAPAASIHRPGW